MSTLLTTRWENLKNRTEFLRGGVPITPEASAFIRALSEELDRMDVRVEALERMSPETQTQRVT